MERKSSHRLQYAGLVLLILVALSYQTRNSWDTLLSLFGRMERVSNPFELAPGSSFVASVRPESMQAGLEVGDRLLAINGRAFTGEAELQRVLQQSSAGDVMTVEFQNSSGRRTARIVLGPNTKTPMNIGAWSMSLLIDVATPLLCLLLGFGVVAVRPRDPLAWLLVALLVSFSQMTSFSAGRNILGWGDGMREGAIVYHTVWATSWPLWMMLFGIYFPQALPFEERHPWIKWFLIVPLAANSLARAVIDVGASENIAAVSGVNRFYEHLGAGPFILTSIAISVFFFSLGYKGGVASTADARRRLALFRWGASISLGPVFILLVAGLVSHRNPFTGFSPWVTVPSILLLFLFPVTLAYVIVVHRALDVRVVVRQGLQYALATRGILVLQVFASFVVILVSVTLASDPLTNRSQKITKIAIGILVIFLMRRLADRLRAWTDRRFFREAYNAEKVLTDLGENVRSLVETGPLIETVSKSIADTLHVLRVAVLLRAGGIYAPAYALGFGDSPPVSFPESAGAVEYLRRTREPLRVYLEDPDSWVNREFIPSGERKQLEDLKAQLLLPLAVKENLLGFMTLGPKLSEEPYSNSDLRLLKSVAAQTGLALENSHLTATVAAEIARREKMNRELEIAREVQERLFPQNFPEIPGLDYAGKCRPALEVGGDYYDFLPLSDRNLGIAIGDVSGKGIPAALLMASLQASLRGQTMAGSMSLSTIISNVNRLVFDASPTNRYATFFFAQYDPTTRTLTYVNAGHNAPMLFRTTRSEGDVIRLEIGGSVIGLIQNMEYRQGVVPLSPGDLLVAFTDGISEAMNPREEEWGEERLIDAIHQCAQLRATEIIDQLIQEADRFSAGADQHDDMTLVVLRVV
ncbi:MAG: SpoIIE family protein phosphatase [Acidobacteriia bacterium]|nr:SpoIIE family protein phosphatase [Terriglobia bacterium]